MERELTQREHQELQSLLGAYALDAVEPDERAAVAAHLADCPRCRAEVSDHREVAGMLGSAGGPAPDGLWERIAAGLEEEPPRGVDVVPIVGRRRRRRAQVVAGAVAAAAAVAAIVVLGATALDQQRRIDDIESAADGAGADAALRSALGDPDARIVVLEAADAEGATDGSVVRAVVGADGAGYLVADGLPTLPDSSTYQLWGLSDDRTVSLGALGSDPGIAAFVLEAPLVGLAVTVEPAGGATEPGGPPLVAGEVALGGSTG